MIAHRPIERTAKGENCCPRLVRPTDTGCRRPPTSAPRSGGPSAAKHAGPEKVLQKGGRRREGHQRAAETVCGAHPIFLIFRSELEDLSVILRLERSSLLARHSAQPAATTSPVRSASEHWWTSSWTTRRRSGMRRRSSRSCSRCAAQKAEERWQRRRLLGERNGRSVSAMVVQCLQHDLFRSVGELLATIKLL